MAARDRAPRDDASAASSPTSRRRRSARRTRSASRPRRTSAASRPARAPLGARSTTTTRATSTSSPSPRRSPAARCSVLVAVADVDALGRATARRSTSTRAANTTSVYTAGRDLPDAARAALDRPHLAQRRRGPAGHRRRDDGRAGRRGARLRASTARVVRNHAKLAYNSRGAPGSTARARRRRRWRPSPALDGAAAPAGPRRAGAEGARGTSTARSTSRRSRRAPCSTATRSPTCGRTTKNRAKELIEDFMIAANGVTARFLGREGLPVAAARAARRPSAGTASSRSPRELGEQLPARARRARARGVPASKRRAADPRALPGPLARRSSSCSAPASTRVELPGEPARGPLRPGGARLHALDRAEPPLPGPRHPAAAEGRARGRAPPLQRRRARRARAPLHASRRTTRPRSSARCEKSAAALLLASRDRRALRRHRHRRLRRRAPGCASSRPPVEGRVVRGDARPRRRRPRARRARRAPTSSAASSTSRGPDAGAWPAAGQSARRSSASSRLRRRRAGFLRPARRRARCAPGRMQRVKPIWAASRMRRAAWPAPRTSPAEAHLAEDRGVRRATGGCGRTRRRPRPRPGRPRARRPRARRRRSRTRRRPRSSRPTRFSSTASSRLRPVRVDAERHAARRAEGRRRDQRLHLDQHRAACPRRWPPPPSPATRLEPLGQEERRGVGHRLQPGARHLEDAQLRDRAEAVLDRAHDAVVLALLALEVEHGVDDVLERLRPGQAAVLGDVADQEDRDAAALGQEQQLRRDLAHLADAARGRGEAARRTRSAPSRPPAPRGLRRSTCSRMRSSEVSAIRKRPPPVDPEPLAAQLDLALGLLAGDVEHGCRRERPSRCATCRSSVLLPIPGSPPISTIDPGTIPPPSTRSNSPMPEAIAFGLLARRSRRRAWARAPIARPQVGRRRLARGRRLPGAPRRSCSTRRSRGSARATSSSRTRRPGRRRRS